MHTSPFLGEFLGTLILILLSDGVVAGVLLKRSKAENAGGRLRIYIPSRRNPFNCS
jgi:glycerol uptake facilitator-like aquaporin